MARAKKERAKYVAVIESLDQEGRGVARRDGKVVFIEGAGFSSFPHANKVSAHLHARASASADKAEYCALRRRW